MTVLIQKSLARLDTGKAGEARNREVRGGRVSALLTLSRRRGP